MQERSGRYASSSRSGAGSASRTGSAPRSDRDILHLARQRKQTRDRAAGMVAGANVMDVEFIPAEGATPQDIEARKAALEAQGATVVVRDAHSVKAVAAPPVDNPLADHDDILSATVDGAGNVTLVVARGANIAAPALADVARQLSRAHGHDTAAPTVTVRHAK